MFRIFSALLFLLGSISLALTLYLWFGNWPQNLRAELDQQRSYAENDARAPEPLIQNAWRRLHTDLAGRWNVSVDPYGAAEHQAKSFGVSIFALDGRDPAGLAEFHIDGSWQLQVPGDWNSQDPRLLYYQGIVWYQREFDWQPEQGQDFFLYVGAANHRAKIYLNQQLVGSHTGGFTPFNFAINDQLKPGKNSLLIKVDNRLGADDVPPTRTDWQNYGGLTRDIGIVAVPNTFIQDYQLSFSPAANDSAEAGKITLKLQLTGNKTSKRVVRLSIPELSVDETFSSDGSGKIIAEISAKPTLWQPGQAKLYDIELQLLDQYGGERLFDSITDEIGFRDIRVEGSQILLNGQPIFLKGISVHEEALNNGGRVHNLAEATALFDQLEALGVNFVRLTHYPHNELMLKLADQRGILVWAEIPVYWDIDFANATTLANATQQLEEMIDRDHNRASVIIWSLGNETPTTEARYAFMQSLAKSARQRDDSRLVSAALLTDSKAVVGLMKKHYLPALLNRFSAGSKQDWTLINHDPLIDLVDVAAMNEYFGWYYVGALVGKSKLDGQQPRRTMLENISKIRFDIGANKPLIVTEFGAGAVAGRHQAEGRLEPFSEEYQAEVYRQQLKMLAAQPQVVGTSPWVLKDFRSPLRLMQGIQDHWNRKGLIDDQGQKKMAFDVLAQAYHGNMLAVQ